MPVFLPLSFSRSYSLLIAMKLTRKQFTHAQDTQLAALGIRRSDNAGWLKKALAQEFTAKQVQMFHSARRKPRGTVQEKKAESPTDRNVEAVREKMKLRAEVGLNKYGVTTERTDLTRLQWLRHAQEEAMDLAVYLERLIREEESELASCPCSSGPVGATQCPIHNPKSPESFANDIYNASNRDLE